MVTGLWCSHDPNFGSLSWFWRCKDHSCPLSPHLGLWSMLEIPDWGLGSWSWFGYDYCSLIRPCSKFWLFLDIEGATNIHVLSPDLRLWWRLEVPDWGLAYQSWIWYGQWSLIHPCSEFWLSILIVKVQRTSMSFKSWFGALFWAGGSWLGFCILILIWIWSLVFYT